MMIAIYGKALTASYCELTAFKYRMRMGTKEGQPIDRDLKKEAWYMDKAQELRTQIKNEQTKPTINH